MSSSSDVPQALDPQYEERVEGFKVDCQNGNAMACHQLAEFSSGTSQWLDSEMHRWIVIGE